MAEFGAESGTGSEAGLVGRSGMNLGAGSIAIDRSLPLAVQVAQLFVVRSTGFLLDGQIRYPAWEPTSDRLAALVRAGVGGVIFLGGSSAELALRTAELQAIAQDAGLPPLFMAADVEEGVGQRFAGATWFPPLMALGAIARQAPTEAIGLAEALGEAIAAECGAVGLNWLLGPVADVNNNPSNPVINVRSFDSEPERVGALVAAFIRGVRRQPILTAAKHFPGHGDTAVDSHLSLPVLPHDRSRLAAIELPPFQAAIAAGVSAIMTAHLHIPEIDPVNPATLSPAILSDLLRHDLGFDGLIVTDALVMGAIANQYGPDEAPILAFEAGADILLMPVDPLGAIAALTAAIESGRIPQSRLNASLDRISHAKQQLAPGPISSITAAGLRAGLARPELAALNEQIIQRSLRFSPTAIGPTQPIAPPTAQRLANEDLENLGTLATVAAQTKPTKTITQPAKTPATTPAQRIKPRNLILIDDALATDVVGQFTPAVTRPRQWGYDLAIVDSYSPGGVEAIDAGANRPTLLQVFARGNPFRGSAGLSDQAIAWFRALRQTGNLQALALYGSPYLLDTFLAELAELADGETGGDRSPIPYVFSYAQTSPAQAIALDRLFGQAPSIELLPN